MMLRKWNYQTHEYDPYEVPNEWLVRLTHHDMNVMTNCAQCGEAKTFGECYTSQEVHTIMGFGYAVCEECYEMESARRVQYGRNS